MNNHFWGANIISYDILNIIGSGLCNGHNVLLRHGKAETQEWHWITRWWLHSHDRHDDGCIHMIYTMMAAFTWSTRWWLHSHDRHDDSCIHMIDTMMAAFTWSTQWWLHSHRPLTDNTTDRQHSCWLMTHCFTLSSSHGLKAASQSQLPTKAQCLMSAWRERGSQINLLSRYALCVTIIIYINRCMKFGAVQLSIRPEPLISSFQRKMRNLKITCIMIVMTMTQVTRVMTRTSDFIIAHGNGESYVYCRN